MSSYVHLQTPLDCHKESYPTCLFSEVPLRVFGCTAYVLNFDTNQNKFIPRAQARVFCWISPSSARHLQRECANEKSNCTLEFVETTPCTVSNSDPHLIALPTNQVPWKTYYRKNLRKKLESPTSKPAPVQDFEPSRDQGTENPTNPCTDNKMSDNDKSNVVVLENVEEKNNGDKTEDKEEISNNEVERGHTEKLHEYDPSLDIPIALRKGIRSLDPTIIPKNIHAALECPEWKNVVIEEMKALEKNKTWEICALPKGHKTAGCKRVFTLNYKANGTFDRHKARLVAKEFT
ncbi:reverse transcriptase [Cucumis melo var. makuwa]|uniref:Reverse transcriptase n=1 Tax=Cucumis melo var. makuwa TaxID=1194695 RepID=A0A5D3D9V2_CUCMM|nr:reverse transcriptase [Cucumis melo var. makuwa]